MCFRDCRPSFIYGIRPPSNCRPHLAKWRQEGPAGISAVKGDPKGPYACNGTQGFPATTPQAVAEQMQALVGLLRMAAGGGHCGTRDK
jgi:hypothetical protein